MAVAVWWTVYVWWSLGGPWWGWVCVMMCVSVWLTIVSVWLTIDSRGKIILS